MSRFPVSTLRVKGPMPFVGRGAWGCLLSLEWAREASCSFVRSCSGLNPGFGEGLGGDWSYRSLVVVKERN